MSFFVLTLTEANINEIIEAHYSNMMRATNKIEKYATGMSIFKYLEHLVCSD
jgi:hypothetical protein